MTQGRGGAVAVILRICSKMSGAVFAGNGSICLTWCRLQSGRALLSVCDICGGRKG